MFFSISDDHSRVVLKVSSNENGTGYINANYIHVSMHSYNSGACTAAYQDIVFHTYVLILPQSVRPMAAQPESWAPIG